MPLVRVDQQLHRAVPDATPVCGRALCVVGFSRKVRARRAGGGACVPVGRGTLDEDYPQSGNHGGNYAVATAAA